MTTKISTSVLVAAFVSVLGGYASTALGTGAACTGGSGFPSCDGSCTVGTCTQASFGVCECLEDTCSNALGSVPGGPVPCGANLCPDGQTCELVNPTTGGDPNDPNDDDTGFCGCVGPVDTPTPTQTPTETPTHTPAPQSCDESAAPACGGECPPDFVCTEVGIFERGGAASEDPNTPVGTCACVPLPCSNTSPPACGGACPPDMICTELGIAEVPGRGGAAQIDPNDPNMPPTQCGCVNDPNDPNDPNVPPGDGDCCTNNGTVGCEQADCQSCVCNLDPFCCDTSWDGICAETAATQCNLVCECTLCGDTAPTCDGACPEGRTCQLDDSSDPNEPNDPNTIDENPTRDLSTGGAAVAVERCLCVDDPNDPNDPNQPPGDCCVSNGTPGCEDPTCQDCVCTLDPFCCNTAWDSLCAGQAANECAASCPCGEIRPTDTPTGTPTDTPTGTPTHTPTRTPTGSPTNTPSQTPTVTPTGTPTLTPTPMEGRGDDDCIDLEDNDDDGLIDCEDPGCAGDLACLPVAPAMSPPMTLVLVVILGLVALMGLARSRNADGEA